MKIRRNRRISGSIEVASAALSTRVAWRRVHMRHRGCHLTMPVAEPCVYELVELSCTSYCIS